MGYTPALMITIPRKNQVDFVYSQVRVDAPMIHIKSTVIHKAEYDLG